MKQKKQCEQAKAKTKKSNVKRKSDFDLNVRTEQIDHGGFRSDNSEEIDGFKSDSAEEVSEGFIDNILDSNNVLLQQIPERKTNSNSNTNDNSTETSNSPNENVNNTVNEQPNENIEALDDHTAFLQELMAEDTDALMEMLLSHGLTDNEKENTRRNRLRHEIADESSRYLKWDQYEKTFHIQNMFWMIRLSEERN